MRLLHATYTGALGLATLLLLISTSQNEPMPLPWFTILPITVWLLGWYFEQRFALTLTFILFISFVAFASYRNHSPILLILTALSAYVAWDVEAFTARLTYFDDGDQRRRIRNRPILIRQHLLAIASIVTGSLILSLITLNATLQLSFWPAVVLSAILAIGLSAALRYLRESDL
ncbi:MAG: hypothetical protein ACPG8W_24405 [Candidatus Promineifilaceae bacterium]